MQLANTFTILYTCKWKLAVHGFQFIPIYSSFYNTVLSLIVISRRYVLNEEGLSIVRIV